jgi:phosphoglycolate phosphatase-like HAD superfamily hydrolase
MAADFYLQPKVRRRLAAEVATGLPRRGDVHLLDHKSPLLEAVRDDPRFTEQRQVMIDLDSTLFPLDRAMRELGVDILTQEVDSWGADGDPVGDAILREAGRTNLLHGKELTPEEQEEKIALLVDFFQRLHSDEELMKRAGVFEFAPQIISDLRERGVKVHIVTHRSPSTAAATIAWLDAMEIEYDQFVCDLPDVADKIKYCQESGIPVILDDKPKTIIDAEAVGIEAVSLSWPYSQKALQEADGEEAACWAEMGHDTVRHLEEKIKERANNLGVDLPEAIPFESLFEFSRGINKSTALASDISLTYKKDKEQFAKEFARTLSK